MTRFKELRRFEAALEGSTISEIEWAVEFAKKMLGAMKLKSGVDSWRKRKEQALARYAELKSGRRLTSA
jgi:hypothetical protein